MGLGDENLAKALVQYTKDNEVKKIVHTYMLSIFNFIAKPYRVFCKDMSA